MLKRDFGTHWIVLLPEDGNSWTEGLAVGAGEKEAGVDVMPCIALKFPQQ
jgi:hypothetical protein